MTKKIFKWPWVSRKRYDKLYKRYLRLDVVFQNCMDLPEWAGMPEWAKSLARYNMDFLKELVEKDAKK